MNKKKIDVFPYLLLIPSLILLLGITFYPFVSSLYYSLYNYSFMNPEVSFVGLGNYIDIVDEGKFLGRVAFTFQWTLLNMVATMAMGFITAILMQQEFKAKGILKATMLVPWILPQVVTGFIFKLMFAQNTGIINYLLYRVGIVEKDFSAFSSPQIALAVLVIANSWRAFPFVALMIYSKMKTVPQSHLEAAELDGANSVQQFRFVVFPYIAPVLLTCSLLTFLWTFNAFDIIKVVTNGGPIEKTTTLSLLLQKEAFSYLEIGRACAMSVMMFCIVVAFVGILYLVYRLLKKWVKK